MILGNDATEKIEAQKILQSERRNALSMRKLLKILLTLLSVPKWLKFFKRFLVYEYKFGNLFHSSVFKNFSDLVILKLRNGLSCDEYYLYDFDRTKYSWEEKKQFLTRKQCDQIETKLNHPAYNILTDDKLIFKRYFSNAGFPVPPLLGVFDPIMGFIEGGGPLKTKNDLQNWICTSKCKDPVFKPIRGCIGEGVLVFQCRDPKDNNVLVHVSGRRYDIDRLYDHLCDVRSFKSSSFLIEKRVHQHDFLDSLNPYTTHTLRIATICSSNGNVEILGGVLRLGQGTQGIDNIHAGNICVVIKNFEEGILGPGAFQINGRNEYISAHPKTKVEFVGLRIPFWKQAKELAIQAAKAVLNARWIGWDIAIGKRGPILIEANEAWAEDIIQIAERKGLLTPHISKLIDSNLKSIT